MNLSNQNPSPGATGVARADRTIAFSLADAGVGIDWWTLRVTIEGVEYGPTHRQLACAGALVNGANFNWATYEQGSINQAPGSDNWPITWADDGHQYASWGDGSGFAPDEFSNYVSLGVARIEGTKDNYTGYNRFSGYQPEYPGSLDGKSYGIVCVGGVLYMWFGPRSMSDSYNTSTIYVSYNHGGTWSPLPWNFTDSGDGIIMPSFLQCGQNNGAAVDNFVYMHAVNVKNDQIWNQTPGEIVLMRVPASQITARAAYEFFAGLDAYGVPVWSSAIGNRVPVFTDARGLTPMNSAAYNAVLGRYFLVTGYGSDFSAKMQIYEAPNPWGPWSQTYTTSGFGLGTIAQTTFYWNFSPKWWNANGLDFVLIFTGAGSPLDAWNVVEGALVVNDPAAMDVVFTNDFDWDSGQTVNVGVYVEDANGTPFTSSYSFEAGTAAPPVVTITTTSLPNGEVAYPYMQTLSAAGGVAPYSWAVITGSLPNGLILSADGVISGSPTTTGNPSFTVRATDINGDYDDQILSINVGAATGFQEWTAEVEGSDVINLLITHQQITDQLVAGQIAAGAVGTNELAAQSVTTGKLAVIGAGASINADPNCSDASAWEDLGYGHTIQAISDGLVGNSVLRSTPATGGPYTYAYVMDTKRYPVDPNKVYRARIHMRRVNGDGSAYAFVRMFDASGAEILPGGAVYFIFANDTPPNNAWTLYSDIFGPGTTKGGVPANAKTMSIGVALNFPGTAGYYEAQNFRVEEMVPGELIVDGAITAAKVGANEIIAQTANLKDLVVQTAKIDDNAVTVPVSAFTAGMITIGESDGLVTVQSLTITTHGQPVHIIASVSFLGNGNRYAYVYLVRGATTIVNGVPITNGDGLIGDTKTVTYVDQPSAGTYTYYFKIDVYTGMGTCNFSARSLLALETRK